MTAPTLDELLTRLRSGDEHAGDALFNRLSAHLERVASADMGALASRWSEPSDIVQQAVLEMLAEVRSPTSSLNATAVQKILHRRVQYRIRDVVRRHRHDAGWSHVPASYQGPHITLSGSLNRREFMREFDRALERLSEKDRIIVRLRALEERTYADIAGQLTGLTPEAVRKRYVRACKRLSELPGFSFEL